jgi:hypothetical protein
MTNPIDAFMMGEVEDRLRRIEERLDALERESWQHRRLGPQAKDLAPDPAIVDQLVETARQAIATAEIPPADRSKRCMLSGNPEEPDIVLVILSASGESPHELRILRGTAARMCHQLLGLQAHDDPGFDLREWLHGWAEPVPSVQKAARSRAG